MTLHAFIEYLKYKWRAKGRHGTHSPFVYHLVEHVLMNKGPIKREFIVEYPSLPLSYENLLSRLRQHFGFNTVVFLPSGEGLSNPAAAMLVLRETAPEQWVTLLDNSFPLLHHESIITAIGIHNSIAHTAAWKKLCSHPQVRMSIDLHGIGVLLFREEFKVQQHFILKY